jgi:hypothetical protein
VLNAKFGVEESVLSWYSSYLLPRSFKVCVNNSYSSNKRLAFSVPQGSVGGPILYSCYASTLQEIIPNQITLHGFADDHLTKLSFTPEINEDSVIKLLESCACDINIWMCKNRLKMNADKTEFILCGSKQKLQQCKSNELIVNGTPVTRSECIKYLGTWVDMNVNFKTNIVKKCNAAMAGVRKLRLLRDYMDVQELKVIASAFVLSYLDYTNSLYAGLPKCDLNKLQRVQNIAAKTILRKRKSDSATEALKELHWLPIELRIKFKILCFVYKCLNDNAPEYLKNLLVIRTQNRILRSSSKYKQLVIPLVRKSTFASRSFSVVGPTLWNHIPDEIKESPTIDLFKCKLKTYFFTCF